MKAEAVFSGRARNPGVVAREDHLQATNAPIAAPSGVERTSGEPTGWRTDNRHHLVAGPIGRARVWWVSELVYYEPYQI